MIILDYSQIVMSNVFVNISNNSLLDEETVRNMILNSIRANYMKFKGSGPKKYGKELVLAIDNVSWRKKFFNLYKIKRAEDRSKSVIDWESIFELVNPVTEEISENFPYNVINVRGAEADDVIGTLCNEYGTPLSDEDNDILIISSDKDFIQLHRHGNVRQYSPIQKKYVSHSNPELYLKEHIVKGDKGDGIPNIFSADDCISLGIKQTVCSKKRVEAALNGEMDSLTKSRYDRNKTLIDLNETPGEIKTLILDKYNKNKTNLSDNGLPYYKGKLFNYMVKNRLKKQLARIEEFL